MSLSYSFSVDSSDADSNEGVGNCSMTVAGAKCSQKLAGTYCGKRVYEIATVDSPLAGVSLVQQSSTEIRASEEKKGGLKYELVLADPAENPPAKLNESSPPKTPISVEDIQNKLKAAEERRLTMEAQKISQIAEKLSKLQEVSQKKQEKISSFMEEAKKQHDLKMESNKENKDAIAKAQQEKLKEHEKRCSEARKSIDNKIEKYSEIINEKLTDKLTKASVSKDAKLTALQERLRLHDLHIQEVKNIYEGTLNEKISKHESKLKAAQEKRDKILGEITERMKLQEKRVFQVRQTNEEIVKEQEAQNLVKLRQKLEEAENKRLSYRNSMQEKLLEHVRHVEEVRQNKQAVGENAIETSG
ncbi:Stathmin-4 [Nymphon striatum]|nr:Stathmin-4 [Nymphon striatum]